MYSVKIENVFGQMIDVEVTKEVYAFLEQDNRDMDRLHNIDTKKLKIMRFIKDAWENMKSLSSGYSAEDELFCVQEQTEWEEHRFYKNGLKKYRQSLPELQASCTEKQWKRFLMHKVYGKTVREIAGLEGCDHSAVVRSIKGVEKKINKLIRKQV